MKHVFSHNDNNDSGYSPWMGFTDLMSGLLIVFIVIGAILIRQNNIVRLRNETLMAENEELQEEKRRLQEENEWYKTEYEKLKGNNLKNLISEYRSLLEVAPYSPIKAEIDTVRGAIVLRRNGDAVFESGKDIIDPEFDKYLSEFRSVFLQESMRIWKKHNLKNIEIRIEGHTDPDPIKQYGSDPFIANLWLSSQRANKVYENIYKGSQDIEERNFMKKNMISVGYSYSRYFNENGSMKNRSIYDRYRTIEFRIISK